MTKYQWMTSIEKKTHIAKPKLCQFKQSHDHALLLLADLIPINTRVTTFKCFIPRNTSLTTFMVRNTRYQVNCPQVRPAAISPPFTTSRPRSAPLETSECPLPTPILSQYYYGTVATITTPILLQYFKCTYHSSKCPL